MVKRPLGGKGVNVRYLFYRFMVWLDDVLHLVDNVPGFDWFAGSTVRYNFCQWSQKGLWREEEKQGIV